jgi:hypothetical protein
LIHKSTITNITLILHVSNKLLGVMGHETAIIMDAGRPRGWVLYVLPKMKIPVSDAC